MRTKFIVIFTVITSITSIYLEAQSYSKFWANIAIAEKKDQPKTIIYNCDQIIRKATKKHNSGQLFKAYFYRAQNKRNISPDSVYSEIKDLETWVNIKKETSINKMILHSILAEIYSSYARYNRRELRKTTNLKEDKAPEDIREWTKIDFHDAIVKHLDASLKDIELLHATKNDDYIPFVVHKWSSSYFKHDLLHLIANRAIEILDSSDDTFDNQREIKERKDSIYSTLVNVYRNSGETEALILCTLDRIELSYASTYNKNAQITALDNLLQNTNKDKDICAEIYLKKANYYDLCQNKIKALALCNEAIQLYPKYIRIDAIKSLRNSILSSQIYFKLKQCYSPRSKIKLYISHKNTDSFSLQLYSVPDDKVDLNKIKLSTCKIINNQQIQFKKSTDYLTKTDSIEITTPDIGLYALAIKTENGELSTYEILRISKMKILAMQDGDNKIATIVADAETGHLIKNANVLLYNNNHNLLTQQKTDTLGRANFSSDIKSCFVKAVMGQDKYMPTIYIYNWDNGYSNEEKEENNITLITDRSIYRPGQTVYLKGIVYTKLEDTNKICADSHCTITLHDANYQKLAEKEVKTNDFGSFTTQFVLPSSCLNGRFQISAENEENDKESSLSFRVEEYKRPTFEITTENIKNTYSLGDTIYVKGKTKTFSGVPLEGAIVKYTVYKAQYSWWTQYNNTILTTDSIKLKADGSFCFPVVLKKQTNNEDSTEEDNNSQGTEENIFNYYLFSVNIDVTSLSGETQSKETSLAVGERSLIIDFLSNKKICKDGSIHLIFGAKNLMQKPIDTTINYTLYALKNNRTEIVDKGTTIANKPLTIDSWNKLPSGKYNLLLTAKDSQNREVKKKEQIVLFSTFDKQPADSSDIWIYAPNANKESKLYFDAQHPAKFYFGTSQNDATVLMDMFTGGKRIESKIITLSNEIKVFNFPYKASYGNGIVINFCFIKNGKIFQEHVEYAKSLLNDSLKLKWSVFRNKLYPGQKEEWKLNIFKLNGKPANAEMLAYMYDASLDKLIPHFISRETALPHYIYYNTWSFDNSYNYMNYYTHSPIIVIPDFSYDQFEYHTSYYRKDIMLRSQIAFDQTNALNECIVVKNGNPKKKENNSTNKETNIRTNFTETAFFYPQLRTDAEGSVSIAFTLPESLTRWKFQGFAHTKDMVTGTLEDEITASKNFMLTPNLPRFLRTGDNTSIAVTVSNLTSKTIMANVKLELFDPKTEQVIYKQQKSLPLDINKSNTTSFHFTVTDRYEILGVRMIADSKTFSDGEQHLLPVLSDKVTLTESIPLPIEGNKVKNVSLETLFNNHSQTATNRSLTIEYSGNPSWYALQALPSLSLPENDNAISWTTALYANSLASYIINSMPHIKTIFNTWKAKTDNKNTLLSNLQTNTDLKSILLNESPWVLEAKNEQEQKERLSTLFDLNNIQNIQTTTIYKLQQLQNQDGAWSWYKGMPGNRYITEFVLREIARLQILKAQPATKTLVEMQIKGMNFLHKESQHEYELIKKAEKEGQKIKGISYSALRYLYLVAITNTKIPNQYNTAYNYFLSKINEVPALQNIQEKALTAIILHKNGDIKTANDYITSIREHLTKTDEQGCYFDFNDNPFAWGERHINAHIAALEAFDKVANDSSTVEGMKIWLLKQKQTQQWTSPIITADAIYCLLNRGVNALTNSSDVHLTFANKTLSTTSKEAITGLGYIKQTYTDNETVNAPSIKIEKKGNGIAWGAAYARFNEITANVKQQKNKYFHVKKKIYVKRIVNNISELYPIETDSKLKIGDIVTARLVIQLDRDMNFVELKEERGACFEPLTALSGYYWGAGTGYYEEIKDASTNFFFDSLKKGVYILEVNYRISRLGTYEVGLSTLQCAYAPEFTAHSDSSKLIITE